LKISSPFKPVAVVALLTVAVFAIVTVAQAPLTPPSQQPAAGNPPAAEHEHARPAPANLKVLPRNLTGDQVHEIMEGWEAALGARCDACHVPDPNNIGPNGRPRLNFADDTKPAKAVARQMYTMTEEINGRYVSKIDSSGVPVTCGTCHRGHLGPEPFVAPAHNHAPPPPAPSENQSPESKTLPVPE